MGTDIHARIEALLTGNDMCVLSTVNPDGSPHCSLMTYHYDVGTNRLLMATLTDTRKWRNVKVDPRVSLLVDTRLEHAKNKRNLTVALTMTGVYQPCTEEENLIHKAHLGSNHPHLRDFLELPEVHAMLVRPKGYLLMDGVTGSHFVEA